MKNESRIVLFGAGATGRVTARNMNAVGITPLAFADNDLNKQGKEIDGIKVLSPDDCAATCPGAEWIATVMDEKLEDEILKKIKSMGVKNSSFWDFIPNRDKPIPDSALRTLGVIVQDASTLDELADQQEFRRHQNHKLQLPSLPLDQVYFPEFITHLDREHFVDCGAADGDTVSKFLKRWPKFQHITAFEPDGINYARLVMTFIELGCIRVNDANCDLVASAVSSYEGIASFTSTGDYSAHIGEGEKVHIGKLDDFGFSTPPTYIKMDIEGSELDALWGARRILREHQPVLAICAYHTADHLWEIPLLIHALQPEYKLFLRRYLRGTWETIWYAVPPERVVK